MVLLDTSGELPLNCNPSFIKQIVRRYIARDIYGNTSPMCYDTILLKRFDTAKVICPKNWVYMTQFTHC